MIPATKKSPAPKPAGIQLFLDNFDYLQAELHSLDLLLQLRAIALPAALEISVGERGGYVTREHMLALLGPDHPPVHTTDAWDAYTQSVKMLTERVEKSLEAGIYLALPLLCRYYGLSIFEKQILVLCLAPELRRSYDTVYAYLQDDITRKKPSIDLALQLLFDDEADRWAHRLFLLSQAPLFRAGLIEHVTDPGNPSGSSGLAQFIQLAPRTLQFLLGHQTIDAHIEQATRLHFAAENESQSLLPASLLTGIKSRLTHFVDQKFLNGDDQPNQKTVIYFKGTGEAEMLELAGALASRMGRPLLCVDLEKLLGSSHPPADLVLRVYRESLLHQAPVFFEKGDLLLQKEHRAALQSVEQLAIEFGWFVLISGSLPWPRDVLFSGMIFNTVQMPASDVNARQEMWIKALKPLSADNKTDLSPVIKNLAQRYQLDLSQIRGAAAALINQRLIGSLNGDIGWHDIAEACRQQSTTKLDELAPRVKAQTAWNDLILPADKKVQLEEICNQVVYRHRVYHHWGFQHKMSRGRGLGALFAGPPGTGKTMAAEVIAGKLDLDLYKIDLSSVVSKYIGETEKNLGRIFKEAEQTDAILFFDEADALFGKRTDVSDARDRYANIETSYLLQKMEEHEGIVIMASNFRDNMDEAFTRRIRFIIEFPFPDAESRELIWRKHFPADAPLKEDVDFGWLAKNISVAGGNIKNIVLHGAFLAASQEGPIEMKHILHGARREYEKIGKLWDETLLKT